MRSFILIILASSAFALPIAAGNGNHHSPRELNSKVVDEALPLSNDGGSRTEDGLTYGAVGSTVNTAGHLVNRAGQVVNVAGNTIGTVGNVARCANYKPGVPVIGGVLQTVICAVNGILRSVGGLLQEEGDSGL